jgi:Domain of unknown function (DUF4410)
VALYIWKDVAASVAPIIAACFVTACGTDINAHRQGPPPSAAPELVVDRVDAADPQWERLTRIYRRALVRHLRESGAFAAVEWPAPAQLNGDELVLSGTVLTVDEGNELVRFAIGFGAGDPTLASRIVVTDAAGRPLVDFEQSSLFAAEGGGSHFNPIDMDDEMDAFAKETAEAVVRWRQGGTLEGSLL